MVNPQSPIAKYYPKNFAEDLNGKKASWEAVVKIPFIDQELLVSSMKSKLMIRFIFYYNNI